MKGENSSECGACDGTGELFEDVCDRYGEHNTVSVTCTECGGAGEVDDADDVIDADSGAEVAWEVRS